MTPRTTFALGILAPVVAILVLMPLWRSHPRDRRLWLLATMGVVGFELALTLAGPWSFASHYLRVLPLVATAATLARRWRRPSPASPAPPRGTVAAAILVVLVTVASLVLTGLVLLGGRAPRHAVSLAFPLRHGTFTVLQGGTNLLMNPFHASGDSSGRLAIDLVRLNAAASRARRLIPRTLTDYAVFGDTVYSPCGGAVLRAISFHADESPGVPNPTYPAGNHIVLACGDTSVLLAHLMRGSLRVRGGDTVAASAPLARVGNSGNTSEPHLHLQATLGTGPNAWRGGPALPIRMDGRFIVTNSLVRR